VARPGDTLQVFGTGLDRIVSARLGGPTKVRDFRVTQGGTVLTCVIPAQELAPGGATLPIRFFFRNGDSLCSAVGEHDLRRLPAAPAAPAPAAANPVVTGIDPAVARPGDTLQVFGSGLDRIVSVRLGSPTKVRDLKVSQGGTVLTCVVPAQDVPPGGSRVSVTLYYPDHNGIRAAAGHHDLHVLPAPPVDRSLAIPEVADINPTEARPGDRIALFGRNLDRITKIRVGNHGLVRRLRVSEGGTVLTCALPAQGLPPGGATLPLSLRYRFTADGSICRVQSTPQQLRILPATVAAPGPCPEVTGIEPAWGPAGTLVTLTGAHLDQVATVRLGNSRMFPDPTTRSGHRLTFRVEELPGPWTQGALLPITLETAPVAGLGLKPGHQVAAGSFQTVPRTGGGDAAEVPTPVATQGKVEPGPVPGEHRFRIVGTHLDRVYAARVNDRPCVLEHQSNHLALLYRPAPGDPGPGAARITLAYRGGTFQAPSARNVVVVCPTGFTAAYQRLEDPAAGDRAAHLPGVHKVEPAQARPGAEVLLHGRGLGQITRLQVDGFGDVEWFKPSPGGTQCIVRLPEQWRPEAGAQVPFRLGRRDGAEVESKARLLVLAGTGAAQADPAAADLDLHLACMYVTQAVQSRDGQVPLVQGRDACLRVFPVADRDNRARPRAQVTVRDASDRIRLQRDIILPLAGVPSGIDETSLLGSWDLPLPGEVVQPGMKVTARILDQPWAARPGATLTVAPTVVAVPAVRIVLVPVRLNGQVGKVVGDGRTLQDWVKTFRNLFPVGEVEVRMDPVWDAPYDPKEGTAGLQRLAKELEVRRTLADPYSLEYHYGVLPQSGDLLGLTHPESGQATSLGRSMVGWDMIGYHSPDHFHWTFAHEMGHAIGLDHAPAGGAQGPDPRYPDPKGYLDCCGFDVETMTPIAPRSHLDIMGYGSPRWISTYHWRRALDLLTRDFELHPRRDPAAPAATVAAEPSLRVSGSIWEDKVTWFPAVEHPAAPCPPEPGPYRLLALDADGFVLAAVSFQAPQVAGRGPRHFAFTLPMTEVLRNHLASFLVHLGGRRLPLQAAWNGKPLAPTGSGLGLGEPPPPVARRAADGTVTLAWDPDRYPEVLALDPAAGTLLGTLSAWKRSLRTDAAELDLRLSDGIRTTRVRVPVLPGA
jgi:hypothetical protein